MHAKVAKRIFNHLKGTRNYGILYKRGGIEQILTFTNSDYAKEMEDKKNTLGYVFLMSGGYVAWSSQKQPIVTPSATKTEFIVVVKPHKRWSNELVHYGTQDQTIDVMTKPLDQTIDVMTKPLKLDSFKKLRMQFGIKSFFQHGMFFMSNYNT
ncbi:hypothetical protein CR513_39496, partial [Mucuna pruriens]